MINIRDGKKINKAKIRLVVSDLDGTLIGKDEVLSKKAIELSKKLHTAGVMFSLATGRVESLAEKYAQKLRLTVPYVACNGATIVYGHTVIKRTQIPIGPLFNIINNADKLGMSIIYSIRGQEFVWRATDFILDQQKTFDRYHDIKRLSDTELNSVMIDKLSICDTGAKSYMHEIAEMCKKLSEIFSFTQYLDHAVEIVAGTASKTNGVKQIADYLGIGLDQIMAIGDHQNDVEVIKSCGIGVAVANATEEAKSGADYICTNSCIDGVIEAVDRFWKYMGSA